MREDYAPSAMLENVQHQLVLAVMRPYAPSGTLRELDLATVSFLDVLADDSVTYSIAQVSLTGDPRYVAGVLADQTDSTAN